MNYRIEGKKIKHYCYMLMELGLVNGCGDIRSRYVKNINAFFLTYQDMVIIQILTLLQLMMYAYS